MEELGDFSAPRGRATRIGICSLFRNGSRTIQYFRSALTHQFGGDFEFVFSFLEGDSTDDTWSRLRAWAAEDRRVLLQKHDVEPVPDYAERVRRWADLGNRVLEPLMDLDLDYILWCDSDLCIPPDLVMQLVEANVDVVAPAVFLGGMFYDTWGYRDIEGRRFTNAPPFHGAFHPHGLMEMGSVGCVVLFRKAVFDSGIRFRGEFENGLLVGVSQDARANGFRVWLDTRVAVIHPTTLWRAQQYRFGDVVVEGVSDEAAAPFAPALDAIRGMATPLLGSLELEEDHPVYADVRRVIEEQVPGRTIHIRADLLSEAERSYRLVLREAEA